MVLKETTSTGSLSDLSSLAYCIHRSHGYFPEVIIGRLDHQRFFHRPAKIAEVTKRRGDRRNLLDRHGKLERKAQSSAEAKWKVLKLKPNSCRLCWIERFPRPADIQVTAASLCNSSGSVKSALTSKAGPAAFTCRGSRV